ncbi:uncharacterized protein LOC127103460 [Lathyrus oleraceus]|uniref:uncharacterized protein LOC127103460 n=1 Tax=Pisum sativum TaxID=3888 RepID=UPI0021D33D16|nr:uncharacterized protein LOC127103460 [Pisum sativum]
MAMPTANPSQTIDLDKHEDGNVQKKKKRKVGEVGDSNDGDSGKQKPCRPKSWVWDHFTRDTSGTRAKCNWCTKSYAADSHKNGTTNLNNHLLHQCKKIPTSVLDPTQTTLSLQEGGKATSNNTLVGIHFDVELCRQALARMIIVDELPFSFVENEGFRYFMSVTQPRLPLPGRISIIEKCLEGWMIDKVFTITVDNAASNDVVRQTLNKMFESYSLFLNFDILNWWKVNSTKYPTLGIMARDILAMPISTVASESAFSTGGRVLSCYRSSLTPNTVEALICAQNWLRSSPLKVDIEEHLEDLEKLEQEMAPIPQLNEGFSDIESD